MKEIYLIRHGETNWNKEGKSQGSESDVSLNEAGIYQSQITGKYLKKYRLKDENFDCIYSSPMRRTRETATIISDILFYNNKIIYLKGLGKDKVGKLTGLTKSDPLKVKFNLRLNELMPIDPIERYEVDIENIVSQEMDIGIDSNIELKIKCKNVIDDIINSNYKKIIIVSHGSIIYRIISLLFKIPTVPYGDLKNSSNCHITYITHSESEGFNMVSPPNTEHISIPL